MHRNCGCHEKNITSKDKQGIVTIFCKASTTLGMVKSWTDIWEQFKKKQNIGGIKTRYNWF